MMLIVSNIRIQLFINYTLNLKYFADLQNIQLHNLIIGINFTYGWMPTVFSFKSDKLIKALEILSQVKNQNNTHLINHEDLTLITKLFNNSLVGNSKILHFINPINYPIIDSNVLKYIYKSKIKNLR